VRDTEFVFFFTEGHLLFFQNKSGVEGVKRFVPNAVIVATKGTPRNYPFLTVSKEE